VSRFRRTSCSRVWRKRAKAPNYQGNLDRAAEDIIQELEADFVREIPSNVIGMKVMVRLHELDQVAYVRYASVYRSFQDIGEFIDEIPSHRPAIQEVGLSTGAVQVTRAFFPDDSAQQHAVAPERRMP
jgi:transcriptional regulator NrdR family protein